MLTIRTTAQHWMLDPTGGCSNQLFLNIDGLRLPNARGFNRGDSARHSPSRLPPRSPAWVIAATAPPPVDDPTICPAASPGQTSLFPTQRQLTLTLASRILDRQVIGFDDVAPVVSAMKAELHRGRAWSRALTRMMRLVLAAIAADDVAVMIPYDADGIGTYRGSVVEVLRRLGRWDESGTCATRSEAPLPVRKAVETPATTVRWRTSSRATQRQCRECGAWGTAWDLCDRCRWWRTSHAVGECERCGRVGVSVARCEFVPGDDRILCRSCTLTLVTSWPAPAPALGNQLFFAGPLAPAIRTQQGVLGYSPSRWRTVELLQRLRAEVSKPVSEHRQNRGQLELFPMTRAWTAVGDAPLPALLPEDERQLEAMSTYASELKWSPSAIRLLVRTLRILFAWLGSDGPINERDIWPLNAAFDNVTAVHAILILDEFSMVERQESSTPEERWVHARIAELPPQFASEISTWVRAVRGHGRRRRPPLPWTAVANYLRRAQSLIAFAIERYTSLSEVAPDDVRHWRDMNSATSDAGNYGVAARSIFSALRGEGLIPTDPTRRIQFRVVQHLPVGLPDSAVRGLLDRAQGSMARAMVALTAIHGASRSEILHLKVDDVDLAGARITTPKRVIYLDSITMDALSNWLAARSGSWPMSRNPHVFMTRNTAFTPEDKSVSAGTVQSVFHSIGTTCRELRTDRILYEARVTEDPVGLMRQFGLSAVSAMSYISAAHPEKASVPPR